MIADTTIVVTVPGSVQRDLGDDFVIGRTLDVCRRSRREHCRLDKGYGILCVWDDAVYDDFDDVGDHT